MHLIQDLPLHAAEDLAEVDRIISDRLSSKNPLIANLGILLTSPGRRRREAHVHLLLARAFGYVGHDACVVASILDLTEAALDLHFEIAKDTSVSQKRGALSGFPTALNVLVSDFLYTSAFQLTTQLGNMALARLLSDATTRSAEGAVLMLTWTERPAVNEDGYVEATILRRGSLIEAAGKIAMLLASGETTMGDKIDLVRHLSAAIAIGDELRDSGLCNSIAGGRMHDRALIELNGALELLRKFTHSSCGAGLASIVFDAVSPGTPDCPASTSCRGGPAGNLPSNE